jgi:flagellar motor component MotA
MILMSGGWWTRLLDLPSFFIVGIVPLLYQLIVSGFKNFKNAFSSPLKKDSSVKEISNALHFFNVYNKAVWMFSLAAILISVIAMMVNLDDPHAIGPNMAVALISLLYATFISLFLILPYTAIAKQRLSEMEKA